MEKDEGPSGEGRKGQVKKDEGPEAEVLPRILIVAEGPCQICSFLFTIFLVVIFAQTV